MTHTNQENEYDIFIDDKPTNPEQKQVDDTYSQESFTEESEFHLQRRLVNQNYNTLDEIDQDIENELGGANVVRYQRDTSREEDMFSEEPNPEEETRIGKISGLGFA